MKKITKEQVLEIIADHIELGDSFAVINDKENNTYRVCGVFNDGIVEITPKD